MAFQAGRIRTSHHVRRMAASRQTSVSQHPSWLNRDGQVFIGKRPLVKQHRTSSSIVARNSGLQRSVQPLKQSPQKKQWSNMTSEMFAKESTEASEELGREALMQRQGASTTIAVLSMFFAGLVLLEGNAQKGWIGTKKELPREYSRQALQEYYRQRPLSIIRRVGQVFMELGPIWSRYIFHKYSPFASSSSIDPQLQEQIILALSRDLKQALTNLGPAWIKAGQQLAIRPDVVHPLLLKELSSLHDAVNLTISHDEAEEILEKELGKDKMQTLQHLELVASASLGQVYKAKLKDADGKESVVAIKIQRPGTLQSFSLDLFLLQLYGNVVDSFTSAFTNQPPYHRALFDSFSHGSYSELDYEHEAQNQMLFQRELKERRLDRKVKIPKVFEQYTTQRVLVTEWVDGVPLAKCPAPVIQKLIPVGVELFLTQLLDIGTFHSDPHPGNILVTKNEGILCLLDFGLCSKLELAERQAMAKALTHLLYRDFDTLVDEDSKDLGFLPEDFDTETIKPILIKVLNGGLLEAGSDMKMRKRKFLEISSELNEIFFKYPFQVPPFFALVTRGLGLLEGIALTGDPNFDIFQASLPYVASRRTVSLLWSGSSAHGGKSVNTEAVTPKEGLRHQPKKFFSWLLSKALRKEETEA